MKIFWTVLLILFLTATIAIAGPPQSKTIKPTNLLSTNALTDNYVPSYDATTKKFTWVLGGSALIDDTKGDGDTTFVWSADKIFDQLALKLTITDIDDTAVDSETTAPISSNWAYDHGVAADPHAGYALESVFGATVGDGLAKSGTELVLDLTDAHTWLSVQTFPSLTIGARTDAPGSPIGGTWYRANDANWDPAGLSLGYDYFTIYNDDTSEYIANFDERGALHLASIPTPTLLAAELSDASNPHTLIQTEMEGKIISNASGVMHLDVLAEAEGWAVIFHVGAASNLVIHPNDSADWYLNGTVLAADRTISNTAPTIGEEVACYSTGAKVFCKSSYADFVSAAE